jgi:hypothetical protein
LNGYRWDEFAAYVYISDDYGQNWRAIGTDLPAEPVNVIKEDPHHPELLYVGTDHGLYISLDRGDSFMQLNNQLPAVAVHDLAIHPRDKDLIVGTHGRSIYIASVKELQQLDAELLAKSLHAFPIPSIRYSSRWGDNTSWWNADPPQARFPIYVNQPGKVKVSIFTESGLLLRTFETDCQLGLNFLSYDFKIDEKTLTEYNKTLNKDRKPDERPAAVTVAKDGHAYLYRGKHKVVVEKAGQKAEQSWEVK